MTIECNISWDIPPVEVYPYELVGNWDMELVRLGLGFPCLGGCCMQAGSLRESYWNYFEDVIVIMHQESEAAA